MQNCELSYPGKKSTQEVLQEALYGKLKRVSKDTLSEYSGSFYFGDNFPILKHLGLTHKEKVDLIYIDPPFGTGQTFSDIHDEKAYADPAPDYRFLEFLRVRLILLRELLSEQGTLYLHIDKKLGHYVKILLDEVFGAENFLNDISRIKCNPKNFSRKAFGNFSDMILVYAKKQDKHIWNEIREPLTSGEISQLFPKQDPKHGPYTTHPLHAPGRTLQGDTGKKWKGLLPPEGRHWRYARKVLDELDATGMIEWSETGNPRKRVYAKDHTGKKLQDVWEFKDKGLSYVSYPTEKNHHLLDRIILQSSSPESIVLDAFAGSGSTLIRAQHLDRKWIGIDESPKALKSIKANFKKNEIPCEFWKWTK